MVRQNATNTYSNSRYIVDGNATSGCYLTIQSAINAANAAGGNATIWVRAGTFTENLTLYTTVDIEGADSALSIIVGVHTPPNAGAVSFTRIGLNSGTDILNSAAAGTTTITFSRCVFNLTNGYACNLTNWTGDIKFRYCIDNSTKNGIVYNTAGAAIYINHSILGLGANVMTANGNVLMFSTSCACPILLNGTGVSQFMGACNFTNNISIADTHWLKIAQCRIFSGATQAITHNSATQLVLDNVIVGTSNATAIGGTGDIKMIMVSFPTSNVLAGTITQSLDGVTRTAEMWANNIIRMDDSGFYSWAAAAPYFDDTTLGTFQLLVGGTGYIKDQRVTWVAQNITGMTAGNCYWIYIDSTGTIGKTAARTDALFVDNIVLFECMRDSTALANNQVTVKENHTYAFQVGISNYLHDVVGVVIENTQGGANITLNGTQGIQINGADVLDDHGLDTTIPDSGGVAVTWIKMFTLVSGKWARQNATTTFTGYYNNGGAATALGANKYGVYRLYVSKDTLNVTTPTYFAVLDTQQYNNIAAAQSSITAGTPAQPSGELASLELAQLGFIIYSQASNSIVQVIISKATLRTGTTSGGTNIASLVTTDVTAFNGWLTAADTNVQAALNTLDDVGLNVTPQYGVLTAGASYAIHTIAVGGTGTLLVGAAGAYPAFGSSASADFTFTTATAAATRTLNVTNTDNTGASYSAAALNLSVGGTTTTGDPFVHWNVTGGSEYSAGPDNSDSDTWKLTSGANPSAATTLLSVTSAGYVTVPARIESPLYTSSTWGVLTTGTVSVVGDGTYYLVMSSANGSINGIFNVIWIGPSRADTIQIAVNVNAFEPIGRLTIISEGHYLSQVALSNFRLLIETAGVNINKVYLAVDLANRNGGTAGINVTAYGDSTYFSIAPTGMDTPIAITTRGMTIGTGAGVSTAITTANGTIDLSSGTGAITIGTDAAAKILTLGNITGATAVNINTGTAGCAITTTNGTLALISGTGAVNVGADAVAKTVTVGNTTGASVLALKCGTGDFTLASASGTIISALDTGNVTLPLGDFYVQRAAVGGSTINYSYNTDNTNAASGAGLAAKSGGTSAGDAYTYYEISGQQAWITGIDNSDVDKWKLSASAALGTTDVIVSTIAGEVTMPLQPAFLAWLASGVNDVTGNGAAWTLGTTTALTEIFDQGADFVNTTFTAPATGRYFLKGGVRLNQITAAMTSAYIQLVTSNRTYTPDNKNVAAIRTVASFADYVSMAVTELADMDAADTAYISIAIFGGAGNTADVVSDPATSFSGFLAC